MSPWKVGEQPPDRTISSILRSFRDTDLLPPPLGPCPPPHPCHCPYSWFLFLQLLEADNFKAKYNQSDHCQQTPICEISETCLSRVLNPIAKHCILRPPVKNTFQPPCQKNLKQQHLEQPWDRPQSLFYYFGPGVLSKRAIKRSLCPVSGPQESYPMNPPFILQKTYHRKYHFVTDDNDISPSPWQMLTFLNVLTTIKHTVAMLPEKPWVFDCSKVLARL